MSPEPAPIYVVVAMDASHGDAVMNAQLLKFADRCEGISRRTTDLATARELRELADEIRQMSNEVEGSATLPIDALDAGSRGS